MIQNVIISLQIFFDNSLRLLSKIIVKLRCNPVYQNALKHKAYKRKPDIESKNIM